MSRFIIALLLFFSLGFLITRLTLPVVNVDSQLNLAQEKTWTEWALKDFARQKNKPEVVILGSSLVLTPVNLADAHFHNKAIDGALHHRSDLLNSLLENKDCTVKDNFNFALPGLMPSDAYLITQLLLGYKDHPKIIVYGVGPRDFVDNLLTSATSTDPYRCLSKVLNLADDKRTLSPYIGKDWQAQLNYFLGQHFPMYGQKEEILAALSAKLDILLNKFANSKFTVGDLHNILPNYNPMSIGVNQCLFQPEVKLDPARFTNNIDEYRQRYRKVNWDTFTCQSTFFVDLLKTARDNNIKVLVVAMPITSVNKQLLPDYIAALYKNNLRVLSKSFGAHLIELDDSNLFNDQDFGDTVHLSTRGSTKLIDSIAKCIIECKLDQSDIPAHRQLAQTGVKL